MGVWKVVVCFVVVWFCGLAAVVLGAWLMFRAMKLRLTGQGDAGGFFVEPKGEVFSVSSDMIEDQGEIPTGTGEPTKAEEQVLKKTERFLSVLSGGEATES